MESLADREILINTMKIQSPLTPNWKLHWINWLSNESYLLGVYTKTKIKYIYLTKALVICLETCKSSLNPEFYCKYLQMCEALGIYAYLCNNIDCKHSIGTRHIQKILGCSLWGQRLASWKYPCHSYVIMNLFSYEESQFVGSGWTELINADPDFTTTSDSNSSVCFGFNSITKN